MSAQRVLPVQRKVSRLRWMLRPRRREALRRRPAGSCEMMGTCELKVTADVPSSMSSSLKESGTEYWLSVGEASRILNTEPVSARTLPSPLPRPLGPLAWGLMRPPSGSLENSSLGFVSKKRRRRSVMSRPRWYSSGVSMFSVLASTSVKWTKGGTFSREPSELASENGLGEGAS